MADILQMIEDVLAEAATPNGLAVMKLHWDQLAALVDRLRRLPGYADAPTADIVADVFPDVGHVRLLRLDKPRQAISLWRAIRTDTWWELDDEHAAPPADLAPEEVARLERLLRHQEAEWDAYFAELDDDSPVMSYEELVAEYEPCVRRVLAHAGVEPDAVALVPPSLRRQADAQTERWHVEYAAKAPKPPTRVPRRSGMRTDIVVVDGFYADPDAVRAYALRQEYYFPYEPEADLRSGRRHVTWMASAFRLPADCPFKSSPELVAALEAITGERIDLDHWRLPFPTDEEGKPRPDAGGGPRSCVWNCCFHVKPQTGQRLGDGVHNHVTDEWNPVGPDGWAGLIYLAPGAPLSGGLKLWRNHDPGHRLDWMTPRDNWELVDALGNVPNRLILARGDLPHSGAGGWGAGLADGRLFQTFFFRTHGPVRRRGLAVLP